MAFLLDSITSRAYWQYVLFSKSGASSALSVYGSFWLLVETLDFFKIYMKESYPSYAFLLFLLAAVSVAVFFKRPIGSVEVSMPSRDLSVEVRIGDIFDVTGAIMVSANTAFEADVAGGKIAPDSLQGQFTARYFTGDQSRLIAEIRGALDKIGGSAPYPLGTTVPVTTHGKTFYLTAMATLNPQGNASATTEQVLQAVNGLWAHVRQAGELQELVVPVVGTGRGRIPTTRKKMIGLIAESFVRASDQGRFAEKLVIVVRPPDARNFAVNLYDVKDHLVQTLHA